MIKQDLAPGGNSPHLQAKLNIDVIFAKFRKILRSNFFATSLFFKNCYRIAKNASIDLKIWQK